MNNMGTQYSTCVQGAAAMRAIGCRARNHLSTSGVGREPPALGKAGNHPRVLGGK